MSGEVAEAIRQTRRTLAEKTWVPHQPWENTGQVCLVTSTPGAAWPTAAARGAWAVFRVSAGVRQLAGWNDQQEDVGAVLAMTLEALIAELCRGSAS